MKKVIGILLTAMVLSVVLSGCYSRGCEQPVFFKGEG